MADAIDYASMARALRLAEHGLFTTTPNPRVGCVIVRDGAVVGEGWHEKAGGPHAEVMALHEAGARARDATAYVSLEPCNHHGRTPPCSEALIGAGVGRVVAAMVDPNPLTSGKGLARLKQAGIEVETGVLEDAARELNIGFIARMTRGRPWVRMKMAASLDGRIALADGRSQWITGEAARRDGHRWRARACAIVTGVSTVRHDDPQLTVRDVATSRQPRRVVVDSKLRVAPEARVFSGGGTLVACAVNDEAKIARLEAAGAEVIVMPDANGRVDLEALLRELARRGMNEIHVEAGRRLSGALLAAGLVDELLFYLAPALLGDNARGMFDLPGLADLADKTELVLRDVRTVGEDLRLLARFK
jgi:diaminohydroxyphosphoribosylaminopyrimidine deaminase/5-amino-6-(5-phosphoribosylamino)uracil reductase